MFEMSTCHLNFFRLWHNGTFFATLHGWRMGVERQGKWGHGVNNEKKSDTFIFVYCINVWLVEGTFVYLFVKIIDWLFYSWPKITSKWSSYVLRAGMIAMCTFLFVLYNVNMSISKLTFWDMVGFWMKV